MTAPENIDLRPDQAVILAGVKPDNTVGPIALDENNQILTAGTGGGGGGCRPVALQARLPLFQP